MKSILDDDLATTLSNGRYKVAQLEQTTVLYRGGTASQPLAADVARRRNSSFDTSFAVNIPVSTQAHIGEVGSQGEAYVVGAKQIVVVKPWLINAVQVARVSPIQ